VFILVANMEINSTIFVFSFDFLSFIFLTFIKKPLYTTTTKQQNIRTKRIKHSLLKEAQLLYFELIWPTFNGRKPENSSLLR